MLGMDQEIENAYRLQRERREKQNREFDERLDRIGQIAKEESDSSSAEPISLALCEIARQIKEGLDKIADSIDTK